MNIIPNAINVFDETSQELSSQGIASQASTIKIKTAIIPEQQSRLKQQLFPNKT